MKKHIPKKYRLIVALVGYALIYLFAINIPAQDSGSLDSKTTESTTLDSRTYRVESVIDGDTIRVNNEGYSQKVRLIGLDTPETNHPNKPLECFGQEATKRLADLIDGELVNLISDPTQDDVDRYDRLLRYVEVEGLDINETLITEGFAYEYTYDKAYIRQRQYQDAQTNAINNERGVWNPSGCDGQR